MKLHTLKINDRVYSYAECIGILVYTCVEIRKFESENKYNTMYLLRCEDCDDHPNCLVLVVPTRSCMPSFRYVETINDGGRYARASTLA